LIIKLWALYPVENQLEFIGKLKDKEVKLLKKDFKKY